MKSKSSIASTIENTERKAQYDKQVKELLADKNILARILKGCVDECKYLTIEEVKLATTSFVARYKNGCFATSLGTGLEPCT